MEASRVWEPTGLEMMAGTLLAVSDQERPVDAAFVHARGDCDAQMLEAAYGLYRNRLAKQIVINGLTAAECAELKVDYRGYEDWQNYLRNLGLPADHLLLLAPSKHTGAEAENMLRLAKERSWNAIAIIALPYHQLRCFLQFVAAMEKLGIDINVYNRTLHNVNWAEPVTKRLMGGGVITGNRADQIAGEYERIVRYSEAGKDFSRNATIQEMLHYLGKRNQRNKG